MNKKKLVFFVGNTSWSMYNFRLEVMKALQAEGIEVMVLAPEDAWSAKLVAEGLPYIHIAMDGKGTSPLKDLKLWRTLFKTYNAYKPDLIFHYTIKPNIYGSVAAAICGIKSIACVTGAGSIFIKNGPLTGLVKELFRFAFRFPKEVWFLNKDDAQLFIMQRMIKACKSRILPGEGIDTVKFSNPGMQKKNNNFTFLFLGRLLWEKGVGEFIDAAKGVKQKFNHVNFNILGFLDVPNPSAISRDQINAWASEGIIEYLGVTDQVKDIILQADCVVLPSYYREGVPRSLLEAASLEKPVITTDVPGCREVVDDKVSGYLCRAKDYKDLQNKMEMLLNKSVPERNAMGAAGRIKIKAFYDMDIIIKLYKEVVRSI